MSSNPISDIITLVKGKWNKYNTDLKTPTIQMIYDTKRIDLRNGDYILFLNPSYTSTPNAIAGQTKRTDYLISADIRTIISYAHLIKLKVEFERILDYYYKNNTTDWQLILPESYTNFSDRSNGLYRIVFDFKMINISEAR